nr:unnamed protein product [Spirometra erinaceieuropaei]
MVMTPPGLADWQNQVQTQDSQSTSASPSKCQPSAASNMSEILTRIDLVGHLWTQCAISPTSDYSHTLALAANPVLAAIPVTADQPSAIVHRQHLPCLNYCLDPSGQHHRRHDFTHSPPMGQRLLSHHLLPPTLPPSAMWTRFMPVPIETAHSPHASAWSVT